MSGSRTVSVIDRVTLLDDGILELPSQIREALDLAPGDVLTAEIVGDEVRLRSIKTGVQKAQEMVRQFNLQGRSLVEELIAERRAEAARE